MRRFYTLVIFTIFALGLFAPSASAIIPPTDDFYINDAANILSESTEKYILEHSAALAEATTAQIVVVTVPNLEGKDLESYATELFRSYGIGDKEKNNGLLMLLALEERQSRIEVGYGLEGALPDSKTGRFQDEYMIPYFKEDNFDEGILNGYKAFFYEVAKEYNYDTEVSPTEISTTDDDDDSDIASNFFIAGIFASFIGSFFGGGKAKRNLIVFLLLELFVIPVFI